MKSMKEIAVSTIIGLVIALAVGTILIGIVSGNTVKGAIESGIETNIKDAAGIRVPDEE